MIRIKKEGGKSRLQNGGEDFGIDDFSKSLHILGQDNGQDQLLEGQLERDGSIRKNQGRLRKQLKRING